MEHIAIVGFGPLGASLGLALKSANLKNTQVLGCSPNRNVASKSKKLNFFDSFEINIGKAVSGARLVILDAPVTDIKDLFISVSEYLDEDTIVTDTGSSKTRCAAWADELLPKHAKYVGGKPVVKKSLQEIESASADIFNGIHYCVMPSKSSDKESVKNVVGMIETIGAKPYFLDPQELDSFSAAVDALPLIMSTAYMNTVSESISWKEMYKSAGHVFDNQTVLASEDPIDSESESLTISEPLIHWIDQLILSLHKMRADIGSNSDDLLDDFIRAWEERARWEIGAVGKEKSNINIPSSGETMAAAFLGDRLAQRLTKLTDEKSRESWKYPGSR
jgi:prephenate dehydrogenase